MLYNNNVYIINISVSELSVAYQHNLAIYFTMLFKGPITLWDVGDDLLRTCTYQPISIGQNVHNYFYV